MRRCHAHLPGPARNAASLARIAAPGISTAPAIITTRPRASVLVSPAGSGSGQPRTNASVMSCASSGSDRRIGVVCDSLTGLTHWGDEVKQIGGSFAACDRAIREIVLAINRENFLLGELLEQVQLAKHDDGVADNQHALA